MYNNVSYNHDHFNVPSWHGYLWYTTENGSLGEPGQRHDGFIQEIHLPHH